MRGGRRVRFGAEALAELAEAAAQYEAVRAGVGGDFVEEIESIADEIRERPASFPEIVPGYRRALASVFPYAVVFVVDGDDVRILAIAHQRRRPEYWRGRG